MLKIHLLSAIRSFQKHKSSFVINLVGLSTGLLCSLLIFLWMKDEMTMDQFHVNYDRIYRVMEHQSYANGNVMTTWSTPGILAAELKQEVPEVEYAITQSWDWDLLLAHGDLYFTQNGYYADADFFKIFTYKFLEGNPETALTEKYSIVISKQVAEKLFPGGSPMGKTIEVDRKYSCLVTGVYEPVTQGTSMPFDFVIPFDVIRQEQDWLRTWGSNGPRTVVTLKEGTDVEVLNTRIVNFIKDRNEGSVVDLFFYPFSKSYLYGRFTDGKQDGGRIEYVRLFSIIAIFILVIACINFMNLSTAKAVRRAKEVGIRKAIGASRKSLIGQFLVESLLLSLISISLALVVIPLALPYFNELTGKALILEFTPGLVTGLLAIVLVTGFLAGSYPALYLSSFQPSRVIKNDLKTSFGELWARKGLVIFQFTISIFLIVAVLVIYSQIKYVQNKNLGYDKENLIAIPLAGKLEKEYDPFIQELKKNPSVVEAGVSGHRFNGRNNNTSNVDWEGKEDDEVVLFEMMRCSHDFITTMGLTILEGRTFSREFSTDTSAVIINEAAARVMGLKDPVVGSKIKIWDSDVTIIGLLKDFNFSSLHDKIEPAVFFLSQDVWVAYVRILPVNVSETLAEIEAVHDEFNPGFTFDYRFQDEQYNRMYKSEQTVSQLAQYFAGLAVLISCLGLFGLAAFTAERRTKEIGIRKVLGASVTNLMMLLTKDFTVLVFLSILIALPLSYLALQNWLSRFEYKIELSWWFFTLAGILALAIAWITVSMQAFRAASVNPSNCLRTE